MKIINSLVAMVTSAFDETVWGRKNRSMVKVITRRSRCSIARLISVAALVAVTQLALLPAVALAADGNFSNPSLTVAPQCPSPQVATWTFTQDIPNGGGGIGNLGIPLGNAITVTLAGAAGDLSTVTLAGSGVDGVAIGSFSTQTATTLVFPSPVDVSKGTTFDIVLANVTNGGTGTVSTHSVSADNNTAGTTSYGAYSSTILSISINGAFSATSVSLSNNIPGSLSSYTITQTVPTGPCSDLGISAGATITVDLPAGDASTATLVGSTFNGVAITSFTTQTATQLVFSVPAGAGAAEGASFDIVIAGVTNNATAGGFSLGVTAGNIAGGTDSFSAYSYALGSEDFGDAPDSYSTLSASGGPRHSVGGTLLLGSTTDAETDGIPGAFAYGDNDDNNGDEDSVVMGSMVPGAAEARTITLSNTTGSDAYLNVWIDFNADGDFLDAGEQVATDQVVANGATTAALNFTVPASPTLGQSYSRIRLCSTANNCDTPGGAAADGEVEDYVVIIMNEMTCTSTAYMVQTPDSLWLSLSLVTGTGPSMDDNHLTSLNAIGYNVTDDRIWGYNGSVNDGSLSITTANADGSFTTHITDPIPGLTIQFYLVGDVDDQGILYLSRDSFSAIEKVDVNPASPTYLRFLGSITLSSGTLGSFDFAISPIDGFAYSVDNSTSILSQIDLTTGVVVSLGPSGATGGSYGASYFDGDGFHYTYSNNTGDIFRLDLGTDPGTDYDETQTEYFTTATSGLSNNDGAMCAAATVDIDFGDAPDSYSTLLASGGPRHGALNLAANTTDLQLGALLDREFDGQPSAGADGDNSDGVDDEDGVVFSSVSGGIGVLNIAATVTGTNATGSAAMLCGYVDGVADGVINDTFDRNVTYVGAVGSGTETAASGNEEVCVQVSAAAGGATSSTYPAAAGFNGASASCAGTAGDGTFSCTLTFNPGFTIAGTTYARFRLTTDAAFFSNASPSPTGAAIDGEAEDFEIGFDPTYVTIGDVGLESLSVGDYLNAAERDQLQALLASYGLDADGMDSPALIAALTEFLDPDGDGQVALMRWDTLEERGTIGFYVERQAQSDVQVWIRVNNDLLPGLITAPMGAEYQLLDPGPQPGQRYQYRLIELEADGNTRPYGPYTLQMP